MAKYILAGVGTIEAFEQSATNPRKIFTSQTLQESGLSISVTAEDIRGGMSNPLLGRYFHDSMLECNITDALFDLNYLAQNVGGDTHFDSSALTTEPVQTTIDGEITIQGTPVAFGNAGLVGWYTIQGQDNWQPITFVGKTAQAPGLTAGTDVCVQYNAQDSGMEYFTISSAIIPKEVHMIQKYPLFNAGADATALSASSQIGELIVDIPRFQFAGNVELSMSSSGAATSALSGSALAVYTTENCNDMGMYATVKLRLFEGKWYDKLTAMAVDGADLDMTTGDTKALKVVGIFDGGTGVIENKNLTFTSANEAVATVDANGVVSAVGSGNTQIEIVATDKPSVICYANIDVA